MKHRSFVTRWDAMVLVALFSGIFTPVYAILQIVLSTLFGFGGPWVDDASGPVEYLMQGTLATLLYFGVFQLGALLVGVLYVTFTPRLRYGILGSHGLEIREGGLFESTEFNETLYRWPAVDRVLRFLDRTFVQFGGGNWLVIPDRDFAAAADATVFANEIRRRAKA